MDTTGADLSGLSIADGAIMDVDAVDARDPNFVSEYVNQIYSFFKETEVRYRRGANEAGARPRVRPLAWPRSQPSLSLHAPT